MQLLSCLLNSLRMLQLSAVLLVVFFIPATKLHNIVDGFLTEGNIPVPWQTILAESALRG